ncbi:putative Phosphoadenylyl-sulfate reductase thioredoxin [Zopfochytrium polystomum]|nr:putative Phosphoadenylyl-sulfate reductase thioredoxin [Zopfochytrium polystomum]
MVSSTSSSTTDGFVFVDAPASAQPQLQATASGSRKRASSTQLTPESVATFGAQQQQLDSPQQLQPTLPMTPEYLAFLNASLSTLAPQQILSWALVSLPGLIQSTAFGLTGLVIRDMIHKLTSSAFPDRTVPLIFIDTLYHFPETLALAQRAASKYETTLHTFKPDGFSTVAEFEAHHGERLWERDADVYDYLVKVEPGRRSAVAHNAQVMITGRRRSQGASRSNIPILELDTSVSPPMLKLNVLASWGFDEVWSYVKEHDVPYNPLHDQGYKSIGDWHSTAPTAPGQGERDGRWAGQEKTECGLHKDYLKMKSNYLAAKRRKAAAGGAASDASLSALFGKAPTSEVKEASASS